MKSLINPVFFLRVLLFTLLFYGLLNLLACSDNSGVQPSADIIDLPVDTGGIESVHPLGSEDSPLGYLLYQPTGAESEEYAFPLLIFLHGIGEKDDTTDPDSAMEACARGVVSRMIKYGRWDPPIPMIVASPHSGADDWGANGNLDKLREFIQFLTENYSINPNRIYLTGYSMGGFGTYSYLAEFGDSSLVAAGIPIAGGGWSGRGKHIKVPVWAFHGADDNIVSLAGDLEMIDSINASNPPVRAKITVFPDMNHFGVPDDVYSGEGMGNESPDYDTFDESVFDWMIQYEVGAN